MKKFIYEARDQTNNKVTKATIQADTEAAAARLLINQGFMPLSIREEGDEKNIFARLSGRITTKDRIVFTRQLATLIGAGLPLSQSFSTVLEQTENKKLQSIIQDIIASIEGGKTLSDSFSKFPKVFDPIFLALVGAGEASGTLDESLQRIAAQQEKDAAIMSKIKGALTYPIIVLLVIMGVVAFMLFTVVPQVEKLYHDRKLSLPFLTQVMVDASNFTAQYWWIVIIGFGLIIYFSIQYAKTDSGTRMIDKFKLSVPIFGQMFKKLYMARFTRTGQTLLSTGVSMLDTLKLTSVAVNNTIVKDGILRAIEKVKAGKPLSTALQVEENILTLVPQMIKIGEQSGRIDEMLGKTAQVYEDELDEQIRTISTSIEPILMVVLAVVAGSMVAAILLPIYSLVNNLG
ncbi:type II secretion system F family protein [Candidatus Saccharibacteria bacterium]|nr:type II secretion system F family protein [Candidatus Saccharibacteria bacterium]